MIISHRHKFAFFRVPKTGSTTAETMIRLSGVFDGLDIQSAVSGLPATITDDVLDAMRVEVREIVRRERTVRGLREASPERVDQVVEGTLASHASHLTPNKAIKYGLVTLEQLREYKCYAFLRDPVDRDISGFAFQLGTVASPGQYREGVLSDRFRGGIITSPAWHWFYAEGERVVTPLDFDAYASEIRRVCRELGGFEFKEIPRLNRSRGRTDTRDKYVNAEVQAKLDSVLADDLALWRDFKAGRVA